MSNHISDMIEAPDPQGLFPNHNEFLPSKTLSVSRRKNSSFAKCHQKTVNVIIWLHSLNNNCKFSKLVFNRIRNVKNIIIQVKCKYISKYMSISTKHDFIFPSKQMAQISNSKRGDWYLKRINHKRCVAGNVA